MKNVRQSKILEIIAQQDIDTQNKLLEALLAAGVKSTQATVSRDIKELRLVKELSPRGTYRYIASAGDVTDHAERLQTIFHESVTSCVRAQNIVVVKTLPTLAPAAGRAIDAMNMSVVVGTRPATTPC